MLGFRNNKRSNNTFIYIEISNLYALFFVSITVKLRKKNGGKIM